MTTLVAGEFCWNELATPNVKQAEDFYGKVFGWQFVDQEMEDMTYTLVRTHDKNIAGIWAIPAEQQKEIPPHWMSYILVSDIKACLEKAKDHGAIVIKGVTQAGEMGHLAIITDPTGAHVALWEPSN
ncbi:VOC family protein [Legionella hackeliae]|uniref:Glyoxylase n=1 Tax=Legionella hackeliae TaxID=449 RepID=A0A0A8UT79_LEGHA|nr:VOC family protein [Legionella hackeliae]KTD10475.1 glyoxylase [Legionella hackeliae]CEK09979.1 Glyoxylase [Legionella hackeliae]STX49891.1 glycoxylase [Legionella hackeliae]